MRNNGKIVATWLDKSVPSEVYAENEAFYRKMYDLGLDMLTTDHPLEAEEALWKYHLEKQANESSGDDLHASGSEHSQTDIQTIWICK